MVKTYFVGKSVAVHLCNKKLIRKVPILLHTGQNECSVLTTTVFQTPMAINSNGKFSNLHNIDFPINVPPRQMDRKN